MWLTRGRTLRWVASDASRHNDNSLVYDPTHPNALTDAIAQLHDDPVLRHTISQNAIAYASQQSWQASMNQLLEVYARHLHPAPFILKIFKRNEFLCKSQMRSSS
jgi:glycosyltransferase involved in cell wall biosynthesis